MQVYSQSHGLTWVYAASDPWELVLYRNYVVPILYHNNIIYAIPGRAIILDKNHIILTYNNTYDILK